jgi:hypothetical protein
MVGIVINDSIVLVTTIDEYAEDRGVIPAIIDGAADRLRPVLLTTLTTVLGLAPLLYEGSNQAEFLKPTVVTLVFGLGFGMVLVMFVIPSLMAIQDDVGKQIRAAKRALRVRKIGATWPASLGAVLAISLFSVTLGPVIVTGDALPQAVAILPALASGVGVAFGLFAGGLAIMLTVIYIMAAIGLARRWRRA